MASPAPWRGFICIGDITDEKFDDPLFLLTFGTFLIDFFSYL
jgi:hypothetical protein